ncbi:lactate utilization protein [Acetobacterium paludosum]|uniref:Lactate utilization protein n=1 Tax=Acetobacterium paludosum TaxID=52693 RepID=A0A923KXC6_9FIRM|nr:lactate utilization protein [Acetobacterium paludosum]MBC3888171.1 lactate utilization protein [Acetobacterium paludosum]
MGYKEENYLNLSKSLIKNFEKRNFEGYYCSSHDEALELALSLIPKGASITHGGSQSIKEIGLLDAVKNGNYTYLDRGLAKSYPEKRDFLAKAVLSHTLIMGTNAITMSGELVNIDGIGNRVALLCFGPEQVIIIAGINKIVANVDAAIFRTQNVAAPVNAIRLSRKTPCYDTGHCGNCHSEDCLCCDIVVTRHSDIPGRIKIILVGENLGY